MGYGGFVNGLGYFDGFPSGNLGHCYIALFLAIYHLGYIPPAKLLYSKGAISILFYIATCYIAIL